MAVIISEAQTRKLIDMPQSVALLDSMFRDRAAGKMRNVPRRRLKGSEKQLNMMAAWHQGSDLICLRAYAGDANTITLYHGRKGGIQAIIDMGYLSSLRTGAATGVAAKYLAPHNSKVADLLAGRGYYSVILSQVVGDEGVVYSTNTKEREDWSDRFKKPPFTNVRTLVGPVDKVALPQDGSLDFAWTHLNYHDLPRPARMGMNKLVFAALKKGGVYGVADHSAREGSGDADVSTLHRIDKQLVIKEVTEAGFKLAGEGKMLSRPDDKRDFNVNKVRNQDDRFVLKFVKP